MTRILLVTVGGTPEPILHAVRSHQPDQVVFVVSAPPCLSPSLDQVIGEGLPCSHARPDGSTEDRPNLVNQLALRGFDPSQQLIQLPDPDDLVDGYRRIRTFCRQLNTAHSGLELIGDYSGGTKTMSTALVLALLEQEAELTVVAGERTNLRRIDQSEGVRSIGVGSLQASRLLHERLPIFLVDHRYDRAAQALREFLNSQADDLDDAGYSAGQRLLGMMEALVFWDRFQWREALAQAEQVAMGSALPELLAWWQRVVAARRWMDGNEPDVAITGYELVQDLLLNAARRGRRGWYDDAIARLYRALELLAQTYTQLELKFDYRDNQQGQGMSGRYRWLQDREGTTGLGGITKRQWNKFRPLLDVRNASLLGHGLRPVQENEWQSLQDRISNLVEDTMEELDIIAGPCPEQLPGKALLGLPEALALFGGGQ
jgi:CRISPR-associated protein (TIGR02710 family)